jgi:hypothetical protein
MGKYKWLLVCIILVDSHAFGQIKLSRSDMVIWDFKRLAENKKKIIAKESAYLPAYKSLIATANELLQYKTVSVMQKTDLPPSGDKHDYMSLAPYWWPNPTTKDGLPYIRKDGEVNPEVKNYPDKEQMPVLCENVNTLALAYYFSNDEKFAIHASKLLRVWFLDAATKMNPNLKFGQAVKGVTEGRAEGLIDTRQFIYALDGIAIIKKSPSWSNKDQIAMQAWMADFLKWINNSAIGIDEINAQNNHGVWLDAQALSMAIFADSMDLAKKIVNRSLERLDKQMNSEGLFPLELARTTSLHYSVFILNAFNVIAQLSERISIDFWNKKTSSGMSLKMGYEAIIPFVDGKKPWAYKEIKPFNVSDAYPILLSARWKYGWMECTDIIKKHSKEQYQTLLLNLL